MRAFCYCRVSTEEQSTDEHYSLDNQEKKANALPHLKSYRNRFVASYKNRTER